MTTNYQIMANDYFNTGGNCMVNITDVYDRQLKKMRYVFINEEHLVITDYDYIRNELPDDLKAEDFMQWCIPLENISHEPAFDNDMCLLDENDAQLVFDCLTLFIKEWCKHTGKNFVCRLDALPNELYDQVTREYSHWLAEKELDPVTDGYHIILHPEYTAETDYDVNGKSAVELQQHLNNWIPANDADEKTLEKWYEEKIHIIVGGKLFTFVNGADIYNGLCELAKFVISEQ